MLDEQQLIKELKTGSEHAVKVWFNTYSARLLRVIEYKVSNRKDAEEIVQQTFLNCLKHLPLFLGKSSIWTWMNSIARHEVADYFRKKYAKKALQTIPLSELLPLNQISDSDEVSQKVTVVLSKMRKYYSELLLLKYADNKKVIDIAIELQKSVKSVESDLFRARKEFKELWVMV
ncbi:MAG: RNA polymerase sigma factor [Patescibacteria group bacterium]|nr:MAG: RNA polymerase sigma factor [Patescibacteria group bacterium]